MKKFFSIFIIFIGLNSCDSGDIIVTSFDLENSNLNLCSFGDQKVLYVINSDGVNETMSLQLTSRQLDEDELLLSRNTNQPIEIELTGDNKMVYRLYDGEIPSDYFCKAVPSKDPRVVDEYITTEGTVVITTRFNDIGPQDDADRDGISNIDEGMDPDEAQNPDSETHLDTDGDGIPNYLDIDDDGDNVRTSTEIRTGDGDPTAEGYRDTDEDGVPNYLDPDDDGDGALTKYEVSSDDLLNPQSLQLADRPNYLNPELTEPFNEHNEVIDHSINRNFRSDVVIRNFNFVRQDGSGEEIRFDEYSLGYYTVTGISEEENEEEEVPDTP
ncbi:hypothetical protein [Salegentibacter sp.]|uniref:hypothetical protein n=1 Tax=Salegentibacter sp. TaxID=1903072 RepID=UPI003562A705